MTRIAESEPDPAMPLSGVRIIDLTRVLAGPLATMILADLGAEVIKVEDTQAGDLTRIHQPKVGGISHYFASLNRNKKSIALNLKNPDALKLLIDLIRDSDVLIENYRDGVMDRLGLTDAVLAEANPTLIRCAIRGFGETHADRSRPSFDIVAQALSGVMSVNGDPESAPTRLGLPMADVSGGLWAAIAICAQLSNRGSQRKTGVSLDVNILDGLIGLFGYLAQFAIVSGEEPARTGNGHQHVVPYGAYKVADGYIVVAAMGEDFWLRFCDAIAHPELPKDERFLTLPIRNANRLLLEGIVAPVMLERTKDEWVQILQAGGVPCAAVATVGEAMAAAHDRGITRPVTINGAETEVLSLPFTTDGVGASRNLRPPPELGGDTNEVLSEVLGLGHSTIDELRKAGAVR